MTRPAARRQGGAGRRVLLTGVAGILGAAVAERFDADPSIDFLVGVDSSPPATPLSRAEFLHADLRHDLLGRVIRAARIDTVVHLGVIDDELAVRPRSAHARSVLGTLNLLAACAGEDTPVQRVVVRSSGAVYGCGPADPSVRRESEELRELSDAVGRDAGEVESYCREHAVRRPSAVLVVLRFGELVAPGGATWMTRVLTAPAIPSVLGFDPRLQLLHLDDAVAAVAASAAAGSGGCCNVGGEGVVVLSQAASLLRRPLLPVLPLTASALPDAALRRAFGVDLSGQRGALLRHGRVLATGRARKQLGISARSSRETLTALRTPGSGAAGSGPPPFGDLDEAQLERLLRAKGRAGTRR